MINGMKMKKELKEFLGDEVDTSIHKLIKGNILLATRFFDQRVKKFFHTIILGKNNPMNVQHYTYKVEFKEYGTGHIHETLWLNLDKLEKFERPIKEELKEKKKQTDESLEITLNRHSLAFQHLSRSLKTIRI